jgi:hypothetical protein
MNPIDEYPRFKINQLSSNHNVQILIMKKIFGRKNFLISHELFLADMQALVKKNRWFSHLMKVTYAPKFFEKSNQHDILLRFV